MNNYVFIAEDEKNGFELMKELLEKKGFTTNTREEFNTLISEAKASLLERIPLQSQNDN